MDSVPSNAHGNPDEQISQLMQCKSLSEQEEKDGVDYVPVDKWQTVGAEIMMGPDCDMSNAECSDMSSAEGLDCRVFFTKEDVLALLNEKLEGDELDLEGKLTAQRKRLELCRKQFQQQDANLVLEMEKIQSKMESNDKKCKDYELRCLRGEPQRVRDGRDPRVTYVQAIIAWMGKFKKLNLKTLATMKSFAIKRGEMHDSSSIKTRIELAKEKEIALQDRILDIDFKLSENEKQCTKLQNSIPLWEKKRKEKDEAMRGQAKPSH